MRSLAVFSNPADNEVTFKKAQKSSHKLRGQSALFTTSSRTFYRHARSAFIYAYLFMTAPTVYSPVHCDSVINPFCTRCTLREGNTIPSYLSVYEY